MLPYIFLNKKFWAGLLAMILAVAILYFLCKGYTNLWQERQKSKIEQKILK